VVGLRGEEEYWVNLGSIFREREEFTAMEDANTDDVFAAGQVLGMYVIVLHPQTDITAFEEFMTTTALAAIGPGRVSRAGTQIDGSELYRHITFAEAREYLWSISFSGQALNRSEVDPARFRLAIGQGILDKAFEKVKAQIEVFGSCTLRHFLIAPATQ
jgi:hypothetical protein